MNRLVAGGIFVLLVGLIAMVPSAATAGEEPETPKQLRDYRYCEIIPFTLSPGIVTAHVYNTIGWNECPANLWDQLTEEQVNSEFGSFASTLNGPRHWVIDKLKGSGDTAGGETFTFGGIKMSLRGMLETPIGEPLVGEQYYVPNQVQRETRYTFRKNRPTFQLIDPDGNLYVMQSYAQITDPSLVYADLADVGSKLALPGGWTYRTRTYNHKTTITADGLAYVVNDDLANAYQRMVPPKAGFAKVRRSCDWNRFRLRVKIGGDTARSRVKFGRKTILKRTVSNDFLIRIPVKASRKGKRKVFITSKNDAGTDSTSVRFPICR